jgi:hypothetical protein
MALWLTIKVSLMVVGAQGGVWAVNFWMPTYLRTVRHLSASGTGLYVAVQAFGALIGFLLGADLAEAVQLCLVHDPLSTQSTPPHGCLRRRSTSPAVLARA